MNLNEAKACLDKVINKARNHFYKPIQIAEVLYRYRIHELEDLLDLESYEIPSRAWRDEISEALNGRTSTSSIQYQNNVFDDNAVPPEALQVLGNENNRKNGIVEAYIYKKYNEKHNQFKNILDYCLSSTPAEFDVGHVIDSFWHVPGLKRSLDKVYEIIVYALFLSLIEALELKVSIEINRDKHNILSEFEDFTKKVMALDLKNPIYKQNARVFRVGVTNAADKGLDIYSNWGPAIQVKHLTLDQSLANSIVSEIQSDRIIIVCKDVECPVLVSVLNQIGWAARIQSVVTEEELKKWYEKALRGQYSNQIGDRLKTIFIEQMEMEFPSVAMEDPAIIAKRNYNDISDPIWR